LQRNVSSHSCPRQQSNTPLAFNNKTFFTTVRPKSTGWYATLSFGAKALSWEDFVSRTACSTFSAPSQRFKIPWYRESCCRLSSPTSTLPLASTLLTSSTRESNYLSQHQLPLAHRVRDHQLQILYFCPGNVCVPPSVVLRRLTREAGSDFRHRAEGFYLWLEWRIYSMLPGSHRPREASCPPAS
jgi:hypothetical protein